MKQKIEIFHSKMVKKSKFGVENGVFKGENKGFEWKMRFWDEI